MAFASAMRALLLATAGLLVASPFLTRKGVGTGEAVNYSLAVADGVTQLREGVFPVLVGQTPFAFNGRVHPLRSAPYLIYLAGAIDVGTGRSLGFPALQNLSLAFSLVASFFAAYWALRWGTRCPPWPAAFLACVYGSGAPLLAAAYSFDLFMTVHAAPFAPLVLGAVARQAIAPSAASDFVLAAALAAAWWAHPPVALWLTMGAGALRLLLLVSQPSSRGVAGLAGAFAFGILLVGFPFISTFELTHYKSFFDYGTRGGVGYVGMVLSEGRQSLAGSVSPVSRRVAGQLGDFQLGYVAWSVLAAVLFLVWQPGPWRGRRLAAAGLAGMAILMVALCVPVPYFTAWAWSRLPVFFYLLTNDWPMQRLYLIAVAAVILAGGFVLAPRAEAAWRRHPLVATGLLAVSAAWMSWEVFPFVSRGFRDRWPAEATVRNFLPSNLNLTVSSYAFVGVPPTFMHGVMEPWMEFRLLGRQGRDPVVGNYSAALGAAHVAEQGTFQSSAIAGPDGTPYSPAITLEPGRRYLLDFKWRTAPFPGVVNLVGSSLQRYYQLPEAGEEQAFGTKPGQRTAVAISTSQATPEEVRLHVLTSGENPQGAAPPVLADFRLLAVDEARLPVRVLSWLPLRADVTAPTDECYVETPRRFIPGYSATVNGRRVRPVASPTGDLMLPVPPGQSRIEVRYEGTPLLRAASWISLGAWMAGAAGLGLFIVRTTGASVAQPRPANGRPPVGRLRSLIGAAACAAVFAAAAAVAWEHLRSQGTAPGTVGPLDVRLLLPKGQAPHQQPIVVTGRPGAGNIVYVAYPDDEHIRVGIDIWGYARFSEPLPVDYNQEQELVVSGGMLYPPGDPFMRALSPFMQGRLRRDLRVELNGRTVLVEARPTYDSSPRDITIGVTTIGGSGLQSRFSGTILGVRRLPVPVSLVRSDKPLRIRLVLPDNLEGMDEPLLDTRTSRATRQLFTIRYLEGSRIALGFESAEGPAVRGAPQPAEPGRPHIIEFLTRGRDLALAFDQHPALLLPGQGFAPGQVELDQLGINPAGLGKARARFTGPILEPVTPPGAEASPSSAPVGPIRILAVLPADKAGVAEPLIVTGRTGKGDVVYLVYSDSAHVRFGCDHWGVGGGTSGPIAVDYAGLHEFEIGMGSLNAGRTDAAWMALPPDARQRLLEQVSVRLDGTLVWETRSPAYPTEPGDIQVGQNRIGASSCAAHFTGEIIEDGPAGP